MALRPTLSPLKVLPVSSCDSITQSKSALIILSITKDYIHEYNDDRNRQYSTTLDVIKYEINVRLRMLYVCVYD